MYPPTNQDGFGANYGSSRLKYWPYRKAQHRLVEMMIAKYGRRVDDGLYVIPSYVMLDTEHAFPTESVPANSRTTEKVTRIANALHLASGYGPLSDSIFRWLKCIVAPGMMKPESDSFLCYAFVFELEPKPGLTEAVLKDEFLKYYRGLCKAVLNGKLPDVDSSLFTLELQRMKSDAEPAPKENAAGTP